MSKIAFVFPGQGAQYVGMGKDFYEQIPVCKEIIDTASQVTGLDIPALCFEENENLNITEYTQIAMVSVEMAITAALKERGITAQVHGGLSLGEYAALAASGVMSSEDVFKVVRQRGIYMQEAVPTGGAMAAVLGLDASVIEEVLEKTEGIVSIANYNCPGQIVITGESKAVEAASAQLKEAGARRVVPLNVSGPFHSQMLKPAGEKLRKVLDEAEIRDFTIPYVTNVTAEYVTEKEEVKDLLVSQISSSVRWQQCVEKMIAEGVDTFIEIGPGRTLSGFLRKISRQVTSLNVEKVEDLKKLEEKLSC
ncbi:[acyl-carrier-protein] S-malonyltransferase [Blautia sp. An249]|uniref:ACP S-malonyltransferase n=1 Tax=Blautia sp. An249 TaxID=1965603 RepID=UPI000B3A3915|nr:ACP S-malonyltransferase [Blautia sp. An249]OUO81258.1 [acyl-carrier-protein] S-malonyltransferase [Blautia sp. An249]